jgi:hypothetical protein
MGRYAAIRPLKKHLKSLRHEEEMGKWSVKGKGYVAVNWIWPIAI